MSAMRATGTFSVGTPRCPSRESSLPPQPPAVHPQQGKPVRFGTIGTGGCGDYGTNVYCP